MRYYAYKPTENGKEPMGTQGKILFDLKTDKGAIKRSTRLLGPNCKVYRCIAFFALACIKGDK